MTWTPDPAGFLRDLETKPAALRRLADALGDDPWERVRGGVQRIVLLGMGSSRFAALPVASRLRAHGADAVAEYASAGFAHPGGPGTLAIGVSASGTTAETIRALTRHRDAGSTTIAITNTDGSPLEAVAGPHLPMRAGDEVGGVACRSYQHTLALLLALLDLGRARAAIRRAADATEDLLARRDAWLAPAVELATATGATFLVAPDARICSAEQGALMLREGPRLQADACEAGDWLHVDVYLTKPLDYRALVFAGTPYDAPIMEWMRERDGRVVAVGAEVPDAAHVVRFPGDDDPDVALLTEILVPELISATVWAEQA